MLYLMNEMRREVPQELGCWKTPGVMEKEHTKARPEEVVPGMRSAVNKACAFSDVQASVVDLDNVSCV